jgi:hypothetical protein
LHPDRNKFDDLNFHDVFVIPSLEVEKVASPWSVKPDKKCVNYREIKDSKYKNGWYLLFKRRSSVTLNNKAL